MQFGPQQQQPQPPPLAQQEQQQQQQQLGIQQQVVLPSPQPLQLPDVTAPLLQLSSSRPQSPVQLPPLQSSSAYTDSDVHLSPASTASGSFPLHSLLRRSQQGNVLTAEDTNQFSNLLRSNPSAMQQGALLAASGMVGRDFPVSSAWFPMWDSTPSDSQAHSTSRMGRADSSPSPAPTFALSSNEPCQSGLTALPMQPSPFGVFRDSSQEQDQVQSDPRSHLLFGVSIDQMPNGGGGLGPRGFSKAKDAQSRFAGGSLLPAPYCSSAGPDLPISPGILPHGSLYDSGFMQRRFMAPVTSPQRSYTKVYKLGSVGRSLDVAQFSNFDDLRAHLARMFGLEGQLEYPQRSGWQLVFVDNENDVLLVGDDPWDEFVNCVRSIRILSPSEVMYMIQEGTEFLNTVPPTVPRPTSSGFEDGGTMPAGFEKSCGNDAPRGCLELCLKILHLCLF